MNDDSVPTLLLVDDDEVFRPRLARALRSRGHAVREAGSLEEARAHALADSPELALVDLRLPAASGLDVVRALTEIDPATNVVV
ncbi:MAG: response regulator, partial [Deltaproteobacteria bacterium]